MVPSSIGTVMSQCQLKQRARSRMLARNTAKLSASPSNFSLSGEKALLYSLVPIAPALGSSKSRMACEHPGPTAKAGGAATAGGAGAAGNASRGGRGAGRTGGAAVAAAWAGGAACVQEEKDLQVPYSLAVVVPVVHDKHVELMLQ